MIKQLTFNPITAKLDEVSNIPELSIDPVSSNPGDAWVRVTGLIADGTPMGLLLALTYTNGSANPTYQFSYKTNEGSIVRANLA